MSPAPLEGIRVLELPGGPHPFGSRLLGGMGADVVLVEPPHGCALRRAGPFAGGRVHPERSLPFHALHQGKRGITLDLETRAGQGLFRRLVAGADVVLESEPVGRLDALEVGWKVCSALNPGLIWTAVTPYGSHGPRAHYAGSDLSAQAMGGAMALTGERGGRPYRAGGDMAHKMAGYVAATATLAAIHARDRDGSGQFVDVSMQEAVAAQMDGGALQFAFTGSELQRAGRLYPTATFPAGLFPASDGWITLVALLPHHWGALTEWIGDAQLLAERWRDPAARLEHREFLDPLICNWSREHSKQELFFEGQRRRIPIGASRRPLELVRDVHLRTRGYFRPLQHAVLGEFEAPGPPFVMSGTPFRVERAAPLLGEHTAQVLGELGLGAQELDALRRQGVA